MILTVNGMESSRHTPCAVRYYPPRFSRRHTACAGYIVATLLAAGTAGAAPPKIIADGPPLPGTARLEMQGDIASQLVAGADRFLLEQIAQSVAGRAVLASGSFLAGKV